MGATHSQAAPAEREAVVEVDLPQLAIDPASILTSSSSSLRFKAAATQDTFLLYGGPGTLDGKFQDAVGVAPDAQGWTGADRTDVEPAWQVSTFNAENLNQNGVGNHAMWAGRDASQEPGWATPPGYGNNWNAQLEWRSGTLNALGTGQIVALDFVYNHDTEPNYDFFEVQYDSAGTFVTVLAVDGSNGNGGVFGAPGVRYSDSPASAIRYSGNDYGGSGDEIVLRLVFTSDGSWSDEDGMFPTDGAVQVDDIQVTWDDGNKTQNVSFEDFEGPGPYAWQPRSAPFVGDFVKVHPRVTDIDPCRSNDTPVIGFVDDGTPPANEKNCCPPVSTGGATSFNWTYGVPGGWTVNYTGGLTFGEVFIHNDVVSPPIPWDLPGAEDDGVDMTGLLLNYDYFRHMPQTNGIWHYRATRHSMDGGVTWSPWDDGNLFVAGRSDWLHAQIGPRVIPSDATHVQVALGIRQFWWGADATPSPFIDNVSVRKVRRRGPTIGISSKFLVNDAFPTNGGTAASTPAERDALDVAFNGSVDLSPGAPVDVLLMGISPRTPGSTIVDTRMVWILEKNPFFEDALRSAPARPEDENVDTSDPSVWRGEVRGTLNNFGFHEFSLPDVDLIYPGDVLRYYIYAEDSNGDVATLPNDVSGFETGQGHSRFFMMRALPSIRSQTGEQPPILLLQYENPEPTYYQAFQQNGFVEGVDFDVYMPQGLGWTDHRTAGIGGPHGGTADQLAGYQAIVFVGAGSLLGDGIATDASDVSDDLGVLKAWHERPGLRGAVYFSDDLASSLTSAPGFTYLTTVMNVVENGPDVREDLDGQGRPVVRPVEGGFQTEFVASGWCPDVRTFDKLAPGAGALGGHGYVDLQGQLYAGVSASVIYDRLASGDRKVDITFPMDLQWVQNTVGKSGLSSRAQVLQEALDYIAAFPTSGTPTAAPVPVRLLTDVRSYPNPFNPSVTISFRLGRRSPVQLEIFNLRGERVESLANGTLAAGQHAFEWRGDDGSGSRVSSGTYIYRLRVDGHEQTGKLTMLK